MDNIPDNTWEIMFIINRFHERVKDLETYSKEYEEYEELYAQAIRIQCNKEYGHVYTVDDFITDVKNGSLMNYDGVGYFASIYGEKSEYVDCDVDWLNANRKDYKYVLWYNK